jgi:hypothetical protein
VAADTFYYVNRTGSYPSYSWSLMGTSMSDFTSTTLVSNISYCYYPYATPAPETGDVIITCSKFWKNKTDTYKLMKYSPKTKTTEIMNTSSSMYFSGAKVVGSKVLWSRHEKQPNGKYGYSLYGCDIASCVPARVGGLGKSSLYQSVITESGEVISGAYTNWRVSSSSGSVYWTEYNLTSSDLAKGTSKQVMKPFTGGFNKPTYLAIKPLEVVGQGPPGPPGPPGAPGKCC